MRESETYRCKNSTKGRKREIQVEKETKGQCTWEKERHKSRERDKERETHTGVKRVQQGDRDDKKAGETCRCKESVRW